MKRKDTRRKEWEEGRKEKKRMEGRNRGEKMEERKGEGRRKWEEEGSPSLCWVEMGNPSQALGKTPALNGDHSPHTRYHQSFWLRIHLNGGIFKIFPSHIFLHSESHIFMCPRNQRNSIFWVSLRPTLASEMWPPRSRLEKNSGRHQPSTSAMPHPLGNASNLGSARLSQRI